MNLGEEGTTPLRLGLLAASPVHYQAPLYRRIAADPRVDFTAIFASSAGLHPHDAGYGHPVKFANEITSGYRSVFLRKADRNPAGGRFLSLMDLDVVRVLSRARYDALWLHGYNSGTHFLASMTQRATGGELLIREEQTLLHPRSLGKTIVKEVALRAFCRGAWGLYIGTQSKLWFEHYGIPPRRLVFTPYCVDNDRLQALATKLSARKAALQTEFGILPDRTPVVLTVSRLVRSKQTARLLAAFQRVRAQRACTLMVVGAGECEPELKATVEREGIPDVVFTGFMDQAAIPKAYACADVFALVSGVHETWGLVVNEAMNFGLPIVVSDKVGCAADLVHSGRNGFIVDSHDDAGLTERLGKLVSDLATRERFGAASREMVSGWSYDEAAQGVLRAAAQAVDYPRAVVT